MGRLPKVKLQKIVTTDQENEEKTGLPAIRDTTNELDTQGNYEFGLTNPRIKLRLNTIGNTRRSMARVLRMVAAGKISHEEGRSFSYMLQVQSSLFKVEQELQLSREIEQLKRMLSEIQNGGTTDEEL